MAGAGILATAAFSAVRDLKCCQCGNLSERQITSVVACKQHISTGISRRPGRALRSPGLKHKGRSRRQVALAALAPGISQEADAASPGATHGQPPLTTPFHLAIPVNDLELARDFYGRILACPEGRSAKTWVDYNLFGHQLVCHLVQNYNAASAANAVDGDPVPVPHFGLAMAVPDFHALAERVKANDIQFVIEPHIRFQGQPGEQWTMFFKDPSGNSLEFKAMTNPSNLFAKYTVNE